MAGVAAAGVAAAAFVHYRSRKAEQDNPPTGRFVEVDGVRLHYVERGSGEPLVLLHGNMTMGLDFLLSDLVDMAARKYRVIVFDRPGYGYSERPRGTTVWGPQTQARLFLKALSMIGVERPIVLGHSWGTLVAMAMGLEDRNAVRGLVLVSGYYYPTARPEVAIALPPATPVLGDVMRHTVSPLLGRAAWALTIKRLFAPSKVPDYFWRFPAWMALRPSQLRATTAEIVQIIPAAMMLSRRYHELSVPLSIITGSEDWMVDPRGHSERLHEELPDAAFRKVEGMGHMLHHLAPREVMAAIDDTAARSQSHQPSQASAAPAPTPFRADRHLRQ